MKRGRKRPSRKVGPKGRNWGRYLVLIGGSALILFLLVLIIKTATLPTSSGPSESVRQKAALIDQIALNYPNPQFTEEALSYLRAAGFQVDVYQGEEITVEFYRTLPPKSYKLILMRTHSTNALRWKGEHRPGPVFLFTSELYSKSKWVGEQLTNQVGAARTLYDEQGPLYFAVLSGFVRDRMVGRFNDTLVVLGGCQSLGTLDLAKAFVERGAVAVIGWDEWVDSSHNDRAILHLLHALTAEGLTVEQAVERTMSEVGPDPTYKSVLTFYPPEGGAYTLARQ